MERLQCTRAHDWVYRHQNALNYVPGYKWAASGWQVILQLLNLSIIFASAMSALIQENLAQPGVDCRLESRHLDGTGNEFEQRHNATLDLNPQFPQRRLYSYPLQYRGSNQREARSQFQRGTRPWARHDFTLSCWLCSIFSVWEDCN